MATTKSVKKRGRPPGSPLKDKWGDEILERLGKGEPLMQICRDEGRPCPRVVYEWCENDKVFAARFARARELGFDAIAEGTLDIADNATNDWMERNVEKGQCPGYELNGEHVQRSKLRIETRLKLLAKWSPKKYGERTHLEHSGRVGLEGLIADDSE